MRQRIQNTYFAVYISDTPVTLKQNQGHQPTMTNVDNDKQGSNHTEFEQSCFNGVREKVNVKVSSNEEICQLSPLNMCDRQKG